MTGCPDTAGELLDAWAGTHAPAEPSPRLPRTLRVIGHPWQAIEAHDGTWTFACNGRVEFGPMTGEFPDVYRFLVQLCRDDDPPWAENPGADPAPVRDLLAPARGILTAAALAAMIWAGMFAVLRWRGLL